jgi:transposase-like protein
VVGYDGNIITVADLPPRDTKRWVPSRKAVVVAAVNGGLISLEEACRRYDLSTEEFFSWQRALDRFGLRESGPPGDAANAELICVQGTATQLRSWRSSVSWEFSIASAMNS